MRAAREARGVALAAQLMLVTTVVLAPRAGIAEDLSDAGSREVLAALEGHDADSARAAADRVLVARDQRFVAVFIELMRASEVGVAGPRVRDHAAEALEALTGESFGADWPAWLRWYAASDLAPPPGFVGFKGRLLGRIDPRFEELLRDEHPKRIRAEEIVWGGVRFEGIPALDRPKHVAASAADWLGPEEPVFGVAIGSEARAYPLRILDWHEMANDELGGVPFSLAYCTLCGSGIAYDTRVPELGTLDFGSSGFLMRSNKLMVDRKTRTLWNQFTGQPVLGPLANREIRLRVLPSVTTRWSDWRSRHPDTTVVALDTGYDRPYRPGAAYATYFASVGTMFPVPRKRGELPEKARIFGIEHGGLARAWPLDALVARRVVNDAFGTEPLVLVAPRDGIWVDGESVRGGPARYSAGAEVRAYQRGRHVFDVGDEEGLLLDEQGRPWRIEEEWLVSANGEKLERRAGVLAYWFGWQSFHPRTELYVVKSVDPAPRVETQR